MPNSKLDSDILGDAKERGITRLVHFTHAESLKNIIKDQEIRSRKRCSTYIVNDPKRLDQHLDHICCSIEYPNVFLLDDYSQNLTGHEWVILFLQGVLLGFPETIFSPVNAATDKGAYIQSGIDGFQALFGRCVGTKHKQYRQKTHLHNCPTDIQAEVLVKGIIPTWFVTEVAVESDTVKHKIAPLLSKWPTQPIASWPDRPSLSVQPLLFDKAELVPVIKGYKR